MENDNSKVSFFERLRVAWRVVFSAAFARQVLDAVQAQQERAMPKPAPVVAPERVHASGLALLSALQREGRLIDFLQQDITSFPDEEVGAAARVVHSGCKKVLLQYVELEPAVADAEGAAMTVPSGFDAQRIRLTGNIAGAPPYRGNLKHHGWVAREIRFPALSASLDPRIVAPAEVELE